MDKLLVILGPTATGKTDLALNLASKFNGELVSCDSRQVYRGLDLGTGKMPGKSSKFKVQNSKWIINGIPVHMYDVADPKTQYTVKDYVEQANEVIRDIVSRNRLPIVVGGTGFYLKGLLEGIPNLDLPVDQGLRRELQKLDLEQLQSKLQALSPIKWEKMNTSDRANKRRLLRSIEIIMMYPHGVIDQGSGCKVQNYNTLKIGLAAPRSVLNQRIDQRLVARINQGLVKEAEKLYREGLSLQRMKELGLEYRELAKLLASEETTKEMINNLSVKIHQYAKRQLTWFKKEQGICWFNITDLDMAEKVENKLDKWYYSGDDQKN